MQQENEQDAAPPVVETTVVVDEWETSAGAGGKSAVLADLARERETRRELEARLRAFEDAQKSELQLLAERAEAAEEAHRAAAAELVEIRLREMRREVAVELGRPQIADLLVGETREELAAHAAKLDAAYGLAAPAAPPPAPITSDPGDPSSAFAAFVGGALNRG